MTYRIPEEVLSHHIAILGKTGSGKTSTSKLAIEQVVADGHRVCILDPVKSDWWGITSSADGKKPGLPFKILGGPHGHLPLHSSAGKAIGQLVGSGKLPLSIIDMADFEAGGLQKFFSDFAQTLMRSRRGVIHLVIEEAHEFAPKERAGFAAENLAIHWAKKLATAGRTKGIRLIVASQRTQALHNAILGSCETVIAHRLTAPADQEPVLKWLKANASKEILVQVEQSLSSLPTGTGWICSGEAKLFASVAFPKFRTYDNTATPTDDEEDIEVRTAPVNQDELRAIIGDALKEAEANDPKALRAEIARLRKAAIDSEKVAQKLEADPHFVNAIKEKSFSEGFSQGYDSGYLTAARIVREGMSAAMANAVNQYRPPEPKQESVPQNNFKTTGLHKTPFQMKPIPKRNGSSSSEIKLPPGERAVLLAAAQFGSVEREQLTILTGYKRSSRDAYIQRLREKGLIEINGQTIRLTEEGGAALPADYEPLPTGRDLQEYWLNRLPEGESKILQALLDFYPKEINRSELDDITGYKRSSRDAYIQRMKAKRLVSVSGSSISASEGLF